MNIGDYVKYIDGTVGRITLIDSNKAIYIQWDDFEFPIVYFPDNPNVHKMTRAEIIEYLLCK
jgi:hypothetical protein